MIMQKRYFSGGRIVHAKGANCLDSEAGNRLMQEYTLGDGIPVLVKGAAGGIFELLTNQQNIMLAYLGFMDVGPCDNESDQRWWLTNVDTGEVMTLGNSRRAWTLITRRCSFGDNRKMQRRRYSEMVPLWRMDRQWRIRPLFDPHRN